MIDIKIIPTTQGPSGMVKVKIIDVNSPVGKIADAELHFFDGPLAGTKLIGFGVWESPRTGRNVTFPARQYAVNGERRSFALLRPTNENLESLGAVRTLILTAYDDPESR